MLDGSAVVRRVWRAEAEAVAALVKAAARGGNGAVAVEALGEGLLVAMGPGRYVNRAIGVGPDLDDSDLDHVGRFFSERGLPASIQLSSWASEATLERLRSRGYRPCWFRSVFAAAVPAFDVSVPGDGIEIRAVEDRNLQEWLEVLADGNEIITAEGRAISGELALGAHRAAGSADFLAVIDGQMVGCGSVQIMSGVAVLGGAATRPAHRGRGVQGALLRHRLQLAADLGCDLVMSTALPAGPSARNLRRHGLHLVDTQLVVTVG